MTSSKPWPWTVGLAAVAASVPALAFVGFVTVAPAEGTALTIYNSADLTLVRDKRHVVMKKGLNALRYEWAGTLIDPTSLLAFPPAGVRVKNTTYPLDHGESLVWDMETDAQVSGTLAVQYFTSGLGWSADHQVTLTGPGRASVQTWVTVTNHSGEDYPNARVRLVVGEVRLVERIAELAQRFKQEAADYGSKRRERNEESKEMMMDMAAESEDDSAPIMAAPSRSGAAPSRKAKNVERESLSELHLYAIEGTEHVPNGGARRMRAFAWKDVEVRDVYRCVNPRGLVPAQRVVAFKNTKDNRMGNQPLPEGRVLLFRARKDGPALDGQGQMPYVPMGEEGEASVGTRPGVTCEAYQKNVLRKVVDKDALGRIRGWEDIAEWELKLVNGSADPVSFEVRQNVEAPFTVNIREAKAEDVSTVLIQQNLAAFEKKTLRYQFSTRRGTLLQKGK